MKNKIFFPGIFTILLASFLFTIAFISCSKEKQFSNKSSEPVSSVQLKPVYYNYGGISGTLNPVPSEALIKIYNDNNTYAPPYGYSNPNGIFEINNILIPDVYHLVIRYIPEKSPTGNYEYLEIRDIKVQAGTVTQLGIIELP